MTEQIGYRFGDFELNVQSLRLRAASKIRPLEPKSFRLLQFLIENRGRAVSKEEIVAAVWPNTFVSDNSVTRAVTQIRKSLNDDAKEPKYIETIPTVGYQFIADVESLADAQSPPSGLRSVTDWRAPFAADKTRRLVAGGATLVALITFGSWWHSTTDANFAAVPALVKLTKLTQLSGQQVDPAFSPDGSSVAFSWGEQGSSRNIYAMTVGGRPPAQLTQDIATDLSPTWSPDGKQIAFLRLDTVSSGSIVLISAAGGAERVVRQIRIKEDLYRAMRPLLAWAPDGNQLVYTAQDDESERASLFLTDLHGDVSRKLADSDEGSLGTTAPAFSKDGKFLAYTVASGIHASQLYIRPLASGLVPQGTPSLVPTTHGGQVTSPVWSRDGKRLFFVQDSAIFEWPAGRQPRQIYAGASLGTISIAWGSGRSLRIVTGDANFSETDRAELRTMSLRPGGLAAVGDSAPFAASVAQSTPRFSPDGRLVAFRAPNAGSNQVWVADTNGENVRQLTHSLKGVGGYLRWSPDGNRLAFHAAGDSKPQIYLLDMQRLLSLNAPGLAAEAPKQITNSVFGFFAPTWSRDAKYIYADRTTGGSRIFRIPVAGGQPEELFEGATSIVTPDGHKIVYAKIGHLGIFSRSLDGDSTTNSEEKLVDDYRPPGADLNPVSDGLYYVSWNGADKPRSIRFYSYAQKKAVDVVASPGRIPDSPSLAVSPDRRQIIYGELTATVKNLTLLEFK
jgi:Tol biopolymer transport system component/DNA-binding winged helix-turn-helix (wHTH) protein